MSSLRYTSDQLKSLAILASPAQLIGAYGKMGFTVDHPVYEHLPTREQVAALLSRPGGVQALADWLTDRERRIRLMEADPLAHGHEPAMWARADALIGFQFTEGKLARPTRPHANLFISGANRSTKTEYIAKRVVQFLLSNPGSIIWCGCQTNETSTRGGGQQERVFKYLPPAIKARAGLRGCTWHYDQKNRFANNVAIFENGSEIRFMNYKQDVQVIEGSAIDGYWCDELVPVEWLVTLEARLIDRRGFGITTFTPIHGYCESWGWYADSGTVTEWQPFPEMPDVAHWPGGEPGQTPYVLQSRDPRRCVIWFSGRHNPFVSWKDQVSTWATANDDTRRARLAGVVRKRIGNVFPRFGRAHIIRPDQVPAAGCNYHYMDFAWNRNWAMIWVRVQRIQDKRRVFVYRDWPDRQTYGEWVLRSGIKKDGERGPAQQPMGMGIDSLKQMIWGKEGHAGFTPGTIQRQSQIPNQQSAISNPKSAIEQIFVRRGDPRSGAAQAVTEEDGGTDLFAMLANETPTVAGMIVEPANAKTVEHGVGLINQWLDYDDSKPITVLNEPTLFISSDCQQVIDCLEIWTGADGLKGASKDFIDLLRYVAEDDVDDITPAMMTAQGGAWGY